jgi:hypothetical protein
LLRSSLNRVADTRQEHDCRAANNSPKHSYKLFVRYLQFSADYFVHQGMSRQIAFWKKLRDGDRIRFELEVQNSVSVPQFLPKDHGLRRWLKL